MTTDFSDYDGVGLAELVRNRQVSASELVDWAIARVERLNPKLNAVVFHRFEQARAEAKQITGNSAFSGVPLLLKDCDAELEGEPVTNGSRFWLGYRAPQQAEICRRLRAAGFVVIGRSAAPECAIMGHTSTALYGTCKNPWDLERTPGGSSGGAAAAVAARIVPIAHGSDGGGSIRIPAAHCGLFGLKPSRGLVSVGPQRGEGWGGLSCQHALTRSVRDSAATLDILAGPLPGDPYFSSTPAKSYASETQNEPARLRVAFFSGSIFGQTIHDDCRAAVQDAAALCATLGHEVEEAFPVIDKAASLRTWFILMASGVGASIAKRARDAGRRPHSAELELATWVIAMIANKFSAVDLASARENMFAIGRSLAAFHDRYDILLTATNAYPAKRLDELHFSFTERAQMWLLKALNVRSLFDLATARLTKDSFEATPNTQLFNLTGQPAMSVPLYWNSQGIPIGVQFVGRYGAEATLFRLAGQLERARPWAQRRPTTR